LILFGVKADLETGIGCQYFYEILITKPAFALQNDFPLTVKCRQDTLGRVLDGEFTKDIGLIELLSGDKLFRGNGTACRKKQDENTE